MSHMQRTDTQGLFATSPKQSACGLASGVLYGICQQDYAGNCDLLSLHFAGEGEAENPAEVFDKGQLASEYIWNAARIDKAVWHFDSPPLNVSMGEGCARVGRKAISYNLINESKQRLVRAYPPKFERLVKLPLRHHVPFCGVGV